MLPFEKQREELLELTEMLFEKGIRDINDKLKKEIARQMFSNMRFDGDTVEQGTDNLIIGNRIITAIKEKTNIKTLISWIARKYIEIFDLNKEYYREEFDVRPLDNLDFKNSVFSKYGIQFDDKNKVFLNQTGYLNTILSDEPYVKFREIMTDAVTRGVKIKELNRLIDDYTGAQHHLRTIAIDSFAEFDRKAHIEGGVKLGLKYFIYSGGRIDTTREFCSRNNGKVFSLQDTEQWKLGEWDGKYPKGSDYIPLQHMGGARCRHFPTMISERQAIRRGYAVNYENRNTKRN